MASSCGKSTEVQAHLRREPDNFVRPQVISNYDLLQSLGWRRVSPYRL